MRPARLVPLLFAAACVKPSSPRCDDGAYCPTGTVCGGNEICLVESGSCADFSGRPPCIEDFGSGHCTGADCTPGILIVGRVLSSVDGAAVEGAVVSVVDRPDIPVVDTGMAGRFALGSVPELFDVVLAVDADGYTPGLSRRLHTAAQDFQLDGLNGSYNVVSPQLAAMIAARAGVTLDPARGAVSGGVVAAASKDRLEGATARIDGEADGPFYLGPDGLPIAGATATDGQRAVFVFLNVEPGEHTVTVAHPTLSSCDAADGPGQALSAPVEAGVSTYLGRIECKAP